MVTLIDMRGAGACDGALQGMFAARKRVFVDLLGWDVPVVDRRFEIDQFDDEHARYLMIVDADGHLGSVRLLPTVRPHLLDTLFPALCAGPVPRGDAIYEISRFCLDRRLTAQARRDVRNRLVTALVEHALSERVDTYSGVAERAWLAQILRFGWEATALGQPMPSGEHVLGALRIEISHATPSLLDATGMWTPTARLPDASFQRACA